MYQKSANSAMNLPGLSEYNWQTQRRIELYRERVIQCLTLADYTKCLPYTLETLIYYLSIEYTSITDNQTGVWVLLGVVVRIAIRMGYHRDGSHSPRLSPFQAEMRRRIWAVIYLLDSGAADQYGLPRMINQSLADTSEPLNLIDEDISSDMEQLRQPRPGSEPSMIGFLAIKNRLLSTQNTITDLTSYPNKAVSYKQILKLDGIIQEQLQSIPPALRMRPLSKSLSDSTDVIANRLFLALISHKSRCLLHRDYLMAARSDDKYDYSRKACIDAALEILRIQDQVREEFQIGRRLYQEQWKFQSSVKHVFFLAMTILCVYLNRELGEGPSKNGIGNEISAKIMEALSTCYEIWSESSGASREARKAAEMLRVVLEKAQKPGRSNQTARATVSVNDELSSHAIGMCSANY
jgi:Fungal specific transcription factor domain